MMTHSTLIFCFCAAFLTQLTAGQTPTPSPTQRGTQPVCDLCPGGGLPNPLASFQYINPVTNARVSIGCSVAKGLLDDREYLDGFCEAYQDGAAGPCCATTAPPTQDPFPCWTCGKQPDGGKNQIGDLDAIVDLVTNETGASGDLLVRKFNCYELQYEEINNVLKTSSCEAIVEQVLIPCACTSPEGDLIRDRLEPTPSPNLAGQPSPTTGGNVGAGGPSSSSSTSTSTGTSTGTSGVGTSLCQKSLVTVVVACFSAAVFHLRA